MASVSRYERDLRRRLRDSDSWPSFLNPVFAERLQRVAVRALARRTVDGDVTAIVIFHQLTEQMLHLLIADSQFLIAVSAMPVRVTFATPSRQPFGQVLRALGNGVNFGQKDRLLNLARDLNEIRNTAAHRLVQRGSLAGLRRDTRKAKRLFDRIYSIFDAAHDQFRVTCHGFAKDLR